MTRAQLIALFKKQGLEKKNADAAFRIMKKALKETSRRKSPSAGAPGI
jgi:hypothetical protein